MAVCDPCHCKFYTAKPCFEKGAGTFGVCFCFASKPRCRFCHKLYDQSFICPWHWFQSGKKVDHVGSAEKTCVGGIMGIAGNFLAAPVLFLALGSAWFRRDGNQALKGIVSFLLFYVGVSSLFILGPFALVFIILIALASTIVDWFVMGRCDECYEYACGGCCGCCFPAIHDTNGSMSGKGASGSAQELVKYKAANRYEEGPPGQMDMNDSQCEEKLEAARSSESKAGICIGACCCISCIAVVLGIVMVVLPHLKRAALAIKGAADSTETGV
mmetsp:Transcript_91502/g.259161  ORF Transcript_91502/g.259161 Transcript_91502/m.259161 type:complete len:272 (-) Transcript_91502:178-993(-)